MPIAEIDSVVTLARARRAAASGEGRRVRIAAGLSAHDLAAALGVSASAVSRWETGLRRPSGEPARRYAALITALAREIAPGDATTPLVAADRQREGCASAMASSDEAVRTPLVPLPESA